MYHEPVLLKESIEGLAIRPSGTYVDATFGGGGHSRAILDHLTNGRLIAFDQDDDTRDNTIKDNRFMLINANYRYIKNFLSYLGTIPVDGIIADLGISSYQIDTPERGFSTRHEAELDLRMDKNKAFSARQLINQYQEDQLKQVFSNYGEIRNASRLASLIIQKRQDKSIDSTGELKEIILPLAPKGKDYQYMAKVFQALRIEVNQELDSLKTLLQKSVELLNEGGRMVVIAYHSLEDRIVKNFLRSGNFEGNLSKDFYGVVQTPFRLITTKAIVPDESELERNPRSRSARLRIAERKTISNASIQ
jgi:16S rRNA (cytosine1402-N4)-methyltransferase